MIHRLRATWPRLITLMAVAAAAGCERGAPAGNTSGGPQAAAGPAPVVDAAAVEAYVNGCDAAELMALVESVRVALSEQLLTVDPKLAAKHRAVAEQDGAGIHRMLERGQFDGLLPGRGGGAYFSFTSEQNDYDASPDIELQRGHLTSGFAGRNAGVVYPIGSRGIADVALADVPEFMHEPDPQVFCDTSPRAFPPPPATVGTTYLVRSVRWDESDLVAAFEIVQKDDHGITFVWHVLRTNEMPILARPSER